MVTSKASRSSRKPGAHRMRCGTTAVSVLTAIFLLGVTCLGSGGAASAGASSQYLDAVLSWPRSVWIFQLRSNITGTTAELTNDGRLLIVRRLDPADPMSAQTHSELLMSPARFRKLVSALEATGITSREEQKQFLSWQLQTRRSKRDAQESLANEVLELRTVDLTADFPWLNPTLTYKIPGGVAALERTFPNSPEIKAVVGAMGLITKLLEDPGAEELPGSIWTWSRSTVFRPIVDKEVWIQWSAEQLSYNCVNAAIETKKLMVYSLADNAPLDFRRTHMAEPPGYVILRSEDLGARSAKARLFLPWLAFCDDLNNNYVPGVTKISRIEARPLGPGKIYRHRITTDVSLRVNLLCKKCTGLMSHDGIVIDFDWAPKSPVIIGLERPCLNSVLVVDDRLRLDFSEIVDLQKVESAILVDAQRAGWLRSTDGASLTSKKPLSAGRHRLRITADAIDIDGQGLDGGVDITFDVDPSQRLQTICRDGFRSPDGSSTSLDGPFDRLVPPCSKSPRAVLEPLP